MEIFTSTETIVTTYFTTKTTKTSMCELMRKTIGQVLRLHFKVSFVFKSMQLFIAAWIYVYTHTVLVVHTSIKYTLHDRKFKRISLNNTAEFPFWGLQIYEDFNVNTKNNHIYIIKQDIRIYIYVGYNRPNCWTD